VSTPPLVPESDESDMDPNERETMADEPTASVNDPVNYHELNKGFPTQEEAQAAINGFWDEFYALRNKYRLADVSVVVRVPIQDQSEGVGDCLLTLHAGSELHEESMLAWAYGQAAQRRQDRLLRLVGHVDSMGVGKPRRK
jgi:hypothetical protein